MENDRFILAGILSILLLFASCNAGDKGIALKENQVEFDTLIVEAKQYLNNDTTNPFCELNVHFVYPVASSMANLERMQQLFIRHTFGQEYVDFTPEKAVEQYKKDFLKNYEADANVFKEKLQGLGNESTVLSQGFDSQHEEELKSDEFYSYHEILSNKVHFNKNSLLSFQLHRTNNKGGSASYSSYNNYVINLQTGDLVTENDLFVAGYDVALQQLFATKLLQQNDVETIYELEELGYFGIEEIMPNRNFLIDDKGVTYIFNKGEYSAYLLDAPEVLIPFDNLRMLLRKNTLVSKLAEQ